MVTSVISSCESQVPNGNVSKCTTMLRCIASNVPTDFALRWSAGANILAFIPTIVGFMSNSIDEIVALSDDSLLLAITLSVSSVTSFNLRLGDRREDIFDTFSNDRVQLLCSKIEECVEHSQVPRKPWWERGNATLPYICGIVAFIIAAGVWYQVYEIMTYGVVVFACPVKANIVVWVGLSQALVLFNITSRSVLFTTATLHVEAGNSRSKACKVILRRPRKTVWRWIIQTFTTLTSFALYAYGTVLLASTTFVPASDAIRAMVVMSAGGGFGRLVGLWIGPSWRRRGSDSIIIDVHEDSFDEVYAAVEGRLGLSSGNDRNDGLQRQISHAEKAASGEKTSLERRLDRISIGDRDRGIRRCLTL